MTVWQSAARGGTRGKITKAAERRKKSDRAALNSRPDIFAINVKRLTKERVREWLQKRFWLRVHMFLIVGATFCAGVAATKLLMLGGVDVLALRYALAVCAAYLTFLLLIRIWLWYVSDSGGAELDFGGDGVNVFDWSGSVPDSISGVDFGGAGGHFGGGGASGSWGDAASAPLKAVPKGGGGGSDWSLPDVPDLGEGCVVLLILGVLVAVLFIAGAYLIWTAPAILGEVAFEAILATVLARRARKVERGGWIESIWRKTVWTFLAVLALSILLGWYAQKRCPEARRLKDAIECKRS